MRASLKPRSIYDVFAVIGCVAALASGTAYAANTVFSTDIVDGEVKNADIAGNAITSNRIAPGSVTNTDIGADAVDAGKVLDASLTGADIANSSLTGDDVASSSLTGIDVSNGSLTSSDILDESLGTTKTRRRRAQYQRPRHIVGHGHQNRRLRSDDQRHRQPHGRRRRPRRRRPLRLDLRGRDLQRPLHDDHGQRQRRPTRRRCVLTTNGYIPNGMTISAQRALTDQVHIKVCNLTGATSAAITGLPVRVITIH